MSPRREEAGMFYFSMNQTAAKAASQSLGAWIEAMRSWNVAYTRAATGGQQSFSKLTIDPSTPNAAFDLVDPNWAMESANLFVRAWGDTVRAANTSWEAATSMSPTDTQFERNPFGITGLFTTTMPGDSAEAAPKATAPSTKKRAPASSKSRKRQGSTFLEEPIGEPDDLTQIKGVGPKLRDSLNAIGIFHFWQLASLANGDIEKVNERLGFKGRIEREEWVAQARELIEHA